MKKYIAGFRSDKKINKIIATIYYGFLGLFFLVGSSLKIDDFIFLMMQLMIPSLIFNFISLFKKSIDKHENRKIFIHTLLAYIVVVILFSNVPMIGSNKKDNQTTSYPEEMIESSDDIYKDDIEVSDEKKDLEIGELVETPLGNGKIEPVYNGTKTKIIGKYITISSSKNIQEEDLIKFKNETYEKLEGFNWIVVEFGDGTALDMSYLPSFDYCNYNYNDGFTNIMGVGSIFEDKVEYSSDLEN